MGHVTGAAELQRLPQHTCAQQHYENQQAKRESIDGMEIEVRWMKKHQSQRSQEK